MRKLNNEDSLDFKFDSRLIGKRGGQMFRPINGEAFDDYIEFQSVNLKQQTSQICRHLCESNQALANIYDEQLETHNKFHEKTQKNHNDNNSHHDNTALWHYFDNYKDKSNCTHEMTMTTVVSNQPKTKNTAQQEEKYNSEWQQSFRQVEIIERKDCRLIFTKLNCFGSFANNRYPRRNHFKPLKFWLCERQVIRNDQFVGILERHL